MSVDCEGMSGCDDSITESFEQKWTVGIRAGYKPLIGWRRTEWSTSDAIR